MTSVPISCAAAAIASDRVYAATASSVRHEKHECAEVQREIEVFRVVTPAIEQRKHGGQRGNEDEEHARHGLAGATHQPLVILSHRTEHAAEQPWL